MWIDLYSSMSSCHHVASSGHRVAPPWPRRMACLSPEVGMNRSSVVVELLCPAPGRRLQSLPSERPDARPTWQCRALCAGVPCVSRAMWPNIDKRRLLMKTITGSKPVRAFPTEKATPANSPSPRRFLESLRSSMEKGSPGQNGEERYSKLLHQVGPWSAQ